MVIAKITNGLGNQMFQYAAARRLSIIRHLPLKLDISFYQKPITDTTPRNFELCHLSVQTSFAFSKDLNRFFWPDSGSFLKRKFRRLQRQIGLSGSVFTEKKWGAYDPDILNTPRNVYLEGFWQNEGYFNDIRQILLKEFQPKLPMDARNQQMAENIKSVTAVSIHIRRGDYANDLRIRELHGVVPLTYYNEAVRTLTEEVNDPCFFIFSDEPEWAKEHLKLKYPTIIVNLNDSTASFKDIWLMSFCKHHIIANSTFSWWGAWLSQHPQQIVYSPKQWFKGQGVYAEPMDIVPGRWIQI